MIEAIYTLLPHLRYGGGQTPPLETQEAFREEMAAAGFRDVAIHGISHPHLIPTIGEYWERTQRSAAPVALLWRKLGAEKWADVAAGVYRHLHQTVGDGPVEEIIHFYLGIGVK